jgi:hypothetical protein
MATIRKAGEFIGQRHLLKRRPAIARIQQVAEEAGVVAKLLDVRRRIRRALPRAENDLADAAAGDLDRLAQDAAKRRPTSTLRASAAMVNPVQERARCSSSPIRRSTPSWPESISASTCARSANSDVSTSRADVGETS